MLFGDPNASPVTVATCASSNKNIAKSDALLISFPLIILPKNDETSGNT